MNETLLLADDDEDFLNSRKLLLEREGYIVIPASTPMDARRILQARRVDLAIIDLRLRDNEDRTDFSGLDVAKESDRMIPKIILTAYPSVEAVREALGASPDGLPPAIDFISKREGFDALLRAIRKALRVVNKWFRTTQVEITEDLALDRKQARREAKLQFWIALAISIGFAIPFVIGVAMAMTEENRAIGVGGAAGALVIEICNYLFFSRLDRANERVDRFHQELLQSKRMENLLAATDQLSDLERRDTAILHIINSASSAWLNESPRRSHRVKREPKDALARSTTTR